MAYQLGGQEWGCGDREFLNLRRIWTNRAVLEIAEVVVANEGVTHDVEHDRVSKLWGVVGDLAWHQVTQLNASVDKLLLVEVARVELL